MKILFVCQYFYPEVFRGNDIAFHWAEEGHEVHVVCGVPNYPKGKFFASREWEGDADAELFQLSGGGVGVDAVSRHQPQV